MYSLDQLGEPQRQCVYYPPTYIMLGPFGLKISLTDPLDGGTMGWEIGGWGDMPPIDIWIDGGQPSKYAAHE